MPPFLHFELNNLPDDIKREIAAIPQEEKNYRISNRLPCIWFDEDTKKCLRYEQRPITCREFDIGCAACLIHRKCAGLD